MTPFDSNPDNQAPLMEHLRRSFHFTSTHLGPHKLPLIGRADWNDCLNLNCFSTVPDESFQTAGASEGPVAESVLLPECSSNTAGITHKSAAIPV